MPSHVAFQLDAHCKLSSEDVERLKRLTQALTERMGIEHVTFCLHTLSSEADIKLCAFAESLAREGAIGVQVIDGNKIIRTKPGRSTLTLAQNYMGRSEILEAIKQYVQDHADAHERAPLTQEIFKTYLRTPELLYPDLIIRTGGERMLPDNLIWQMAYAEFWTTPKHWAELDVGDLEEALKSYQLRERRFGQVLQVSS